MSTQQSATLPGCDSKSRRKKKADVIVIRIFQRPGSRFYQAEIRGPGGRRKRITTKTTLEQASREFAELAYRHFCHLGGRSETPPPRSSTHSRS